VVIGVLTIEFHLPGTRSLKEKRMVIGRLKARLQSRYNVSVAEVDYQDKWQRAVLALAVVSSEQPLAARLLEKICRELETGRHSGNVVRTQVDYVE
jgi:uncharacterized protein YlxP (DUF503 family)